MSNENPVAPELVNEHGQSVDEKLLKKNRNLFALGNISFISVAQAIGAGIPMKIIKLFGGSDQHIGVFGSLGGLNSLCQFLGALALRRTGSDKRGMRWVLGIAAVLALLAAGSVFSFYLPFSKILALYAFLALVIGVNILVGGINNIDASWIGDLVPREKLGWFNSVKFIGANIGILVLGLALGRYADLFPNAAGYASVYVILGVFFFLGILIYGLATDRAPKNLNFFSGGASRHERLNYGSLALWCYITFYSLWACGRSIIYAFFTIFLLEEFHFSMLNLAWLGSLTLAVSLAALYGFGKLSDRRGNRKILIAVSASIALCMYLWVGAAWLGLAPIIAYYIINGAAGQAHAMLGINLGLEIFPDKGRAAYIAFSRIFIGAMAFLGPILAGWVLHLYGDMQLTVAGKTLTKYYLAFATGATITLCCVIPLLIMGKRRVE